jgi:hypothetical protein
MPNRKPRRASQDAQVPLSRHGANLPCSRIPSTASRESFGSGSPELPFQSRSDLIISSLYPSSSSVRSRTRESEPSLCVFRRIRSANPVDLGRELRIWTVHPLPHPMRTQPLHAQDTLDTTATDPHPRGATGGNRQGPLTPNAARRGVLLCGRITGKLHNVTTSRDRNSRGAARTLPVV